MLYFKDKKVYTQVARDEAIRLTGRAPIAVKWVDVNKGDDEEPNYRSRLVAKDYRRKGEDSIFAPTPPLESLRTLLMMAATPKLWAPEWVDSNDLHRMQVSLVKLRLRD